MPHSSSASARLRRQPRRAKSTSLLSSITLFALLLVAVLCFLPAGSIVKAQKEDNDYGTVIGIDLGTTYSCVAYVSAGAQTGDLTDVQGPKRWQS